MTHIICHFCQHSFCVEQGARRSLPRVTSDCRPAPRTGALVVCPSCGLAQTAISDDWRGAAMTTYSEYSIYEASGGAEQKIVSESGLQSRSDVLVGKLASLGELAAKGKLLDVGCGNGAFLRAFSAKFPEWELDGSETDHRNLLRLREIPNFRNFHGVDVSKLPCGYDAISMVHVLEHIENPAELLRNLLQHAAPEALLLVEVPSWKANPFALMISDHASHFTVESLQMVVNASGWQTKMVSADWVPKEVSLVGHNSRSAVVASSKLDASRESEALQEAVRWLSEVMADARRIAETSADFGLFGSAIAATWLYQGMSDKVRFFVDEDPQKIGRTHLGLPILAPADVPPDSDVFVGISPIFSESLAARLSAGTRRFHPARKSSSCTVA